MGKKWIIQSTRSKMADNDFGPFLENVYDEVHRCKKRAKYLQLIEKSTVEWLLCIISLETSFVYVCMYKNVKTNKREKNEQFKALDQKWLTMIFRPIFRTIYDEADAFL